MTFLSSVLLLIPACDDGGDMSGDTDFDVEDTGVGADEAEHRLTNAFDGSSTFWNAVVLVSGGCTGTLIHDQYVLTAGHCIGGRTNPAVPGQWYDLSPLPIAIGPNRNAPQQVVNAVEFSEAGYDDIILLRLDRTVPRSTAVPAPPITDIPSSGDANDWLAAQSYTMSGFGIDDSGFLATVRRRASATFDDYPIVSFGALEVNLLRATGTGCATVRGGDSGSPLLWYDVNTATQRMVGVAQGTEGCGGRYVATFGEGGTHVSGNPKPDIGDWLESSIPMDFDVTQRISTGCTGSGGSPEVYVEVTNLGLTSGSAWIDVFVGEASPPAIGTLSDIYRSTGTLQPGQTKLYSFTLPDTLETQTQWVDVLLDTTESRTEANEDNNHEDARITFPDCSFN